MCAIEDYKGRPAGLYYLRTKDGWEVDFCLAKNDEPQKIIEVKRADSNISKPLIYFNEKYNIGALQLVQYLKREKMAGEISI